MAKEQRGIQSIDVGGRLLQALTRSDGAMMLKDLAEAADMPPAKAHAYLVSFCKLGLMEQDAVTGRYDLGPLALAERRSLGRRQQRRQFRRCLQEPFLMRRRRR